MGTGDVLRWVILAALAAGLVLALRRVALWRQGRPAPVDWVRGLMRLPRSYFVDVHHVVARDSYAAHMHIAAAGGFVGGAVLVFLVHVLGLRTPWLAWPLLLLLALMLAGTAMVAKRRWPAPPPRLSRGPWMRLPASLAAFALGCILVTLPAAGLMDEPGWSSTYGLLALALAAWGAVEMIALIGPGPMRHAFAGAMHLVAHPRPARLGAERPDSGLRPLDLDAARLGAQTATDFAWNRLLGFDACVQCGRCEQACPAFAAEQPLNPKKVIQDLVRAMDGRSDADYAGSPHPGREPGGIQGGPEREIVGANALIHPDTLWSCTTCRACVQECPMMIEHVDAIVDMRRFQALERGAVPGKAAAALDQLRDADNPSGLPPARRTDWAADLNLRVLGEGESCDVLLWQGDAAFDLRGQRTLRALVRLLRRAEVDFAVLGEAEADCGDLARRLGDEATFQRLARRNVGLLGKRRFERILTADPHAFHVLRNEYPAFGGRWQVVHHSTFLNGLVGNRKLVPAKAPEGRMTYHDPCYLGRYNGEVAAPRALLDALGAERVEMERHAMRSLCCGGGGGAPLTDIPGRRRIPDIRMDQARATGAATVAVACPNCALMLEGVVGQRPEVRDLAELLLESVEGGP